jgi:Flp pilus assembly protein TadD
MVKNLFMKKSFIMLTAALSGLTLVSAQEKKPAEAAAAPANAEKAATPAQEGEKTAVDIATSQDPTRANFEKLSEDKKKEFIKHMNEASRLVNTIRMQEALASVIKAELVLSDSFVLQNLKGAIYTKIRLFDEAKACFNKAQKLFPGSFQPAFNLAEIEFVKQNFSQAEKMFESTVQLSLAEEKKIKDYIATLPADTNPFMMNAYHNQASTQAGTTSLLRFKILCCKLKQKQTAEAEKYFTDNFDYLEETPAYWLGKMAFDLSKKKIDNPLDNENLISARRIFPQPQIDIFWDSFKELDWVETLLK